jgi:hypothetical protein
MPGGISLTSSPTFSVSGYQAVLAADENGRQPLRTRARRGYAVREAMIIARVTLLDIVYRHAVIRGGGSNDDDAGLELLMTCIRKIRSLVASVLMSSEPERLPLGGVARGVDDQLEGTQSACMLLDIGYDDEFVGVHFLNELVDASSNGVRRSNDGASEHPHHLHRSIGARIASHNSD